MRVVLPKGQEQLERSAADLLESAPAESLAALESMLTTVVLEPRGGLTQLCTTSADLAHQLTAPLIDQATVFLSSLLPSEDVSAVEHSAARGSPDELARRVSSYIRGAAPLTGGPARMPLKGEAPWASESGSGEDPGRATGAAPGAGARAPEFADPLSFALSELQPANPRHKATRPTQATQRTAWPSLSWSHRRCVGMSVPRPCRGWDRRPA